MRSLYKGADMTSKQRAYLKGLAMNLDPIFQIGKSSLTPEVTQAVAEALEARELIKITVLKNCLDDGRSIAEVLAERTHSQVVRTQDRTVPSGKGRDKKKDRTSEITGRGEIRYGKDWAFRRYI